MKLAWPEALPARHPLLGHRCFEAELSGVVRYDPPRARLARDGVAVIELPEDFASEARERFRARHGIELEAPEFGFHMTLFRGGSEAEASRKAWGMLDGERVPVRLTGELFWKGRCVWANAHCPAYDMLRSVVCGIDDSDPESWGHATIGCFPPGAELPRFLDYRDLDDWGFRP